VQHNCLCVKRCYNDAHHKTGHVRLKLGSCFVNMNYKKRLEVREWGTTNYPELLKKMCFKIFEKVQDSAVGIATVYELDGPGIESRWGRDFSVRIQTGPGAHTASYTMATGSFPGVKRPGRGVD